MSTNKSDFGKGLVYNLVLFSMHFDNQFANEISNHHFVINHPEKELILVDNPDGTIK